MGAGVTETVSLFLAVLDRVIRETPSTVTLRRVTESFIMLIDTRTITEFGIMIFSPLTQSHGFRLQVTLSTSLAKNVEFLIKPIKDKIFSKNHRYR